MSENAIDLVADLDVVFLVSLAFCRRARTKMMFSTGEGMYYEGSRLCLAKEDEVQEIRLGAPYPSMTLRSHSSMMLRSHSATSMRRTWASHPPHFESHTKVTGRSAFTDTMIDF